MLAEEDLQGIAREIRELFPVKRIVVFGSYARGDAHQCSDLNICLILNESEDPPVEPWPSKSWLHRGVAVRRQIGSPEAALDPVVFTRQEFDALKDREHPLVRQILEEGRVIYEQ